MPANIVYRPGKNSLSVRWLLTLHAVRRHVQQGTNAVTFGDEVYPRTAIAALANNDPDYPGSCGRCYEIRCHTGPVIANGTSVYRTDQGRVALCAMTYAWLLDSSQQRCSTFTSCIFKQASLETSLLLACKTDDVE